MPAPAVPELRRCGSAISGFLQSTNPTGGSRMMTNRWVVRVESTAELRDSSASARQPKIHCGAPDCLSTPGSPDGDPAAARGGPGARRVDDHLSLSSGLLSTTRSAAVTSTTPRPHREEQG